MLSLNQIRFCAAECERQQSGEMSVYWMCNALYTIAFLDEVELSHEFIQLLGTQVEPKKNANGYRKTPVTIGNEIIGWTEIVHQMDNLLVLFGSNGDFPNDTTDGAKFFYEEFEKIHPFIDGNGRVGAILYNYLVGTLDYPVAPPDVFGNADKFQSYAEIEYREGIRKS